MRKKLVRYLSLAVISIIMFAILGQAKLMDNVVYALTTSNTDGVSDGNPIYNLKIITGEKLINVQEGPNVYKADISNNMDRVDIQFASIPGVDPNDFIITGSNNTIVGSISIEEPILIIDNLKEGLNIIKIRKKLDNTELYKFYINYKKVQISELKSVVNTGDKFNLYAEIDGKVFNNIKWASVGINSVMMSEEGEVTALNNGIATIIATIYDNKGDNIIGSLHLEFNVCGESKLGWINNSGKWYYIDEDTNSFKIGWFFDNGKWYFLGADGSIEKGWIYKNECWFYLKDNGQMATGWVKDNGKWHLLSEDGSMKTGWVKDHGNWYYLNSDGSMETKTKEIDGKVYYFNKIGELV